MEVTLVGVGAGDICAQIVGPGCCICPGPQGLEFYLHAVLAAWRKVDSLVAVDGAAHADAVTIGSGIIDGTAAQCLDAPLMKTGVVSCTTDFYRGTHREWVGDGGVLAAPCGIGHRIGSAAVGAFQGLEVDEGAAVVARAYLHSCGGGRPTVGSRRGAIGGADGIGAVTVVGNLHIGGVEAAHHLRQVGAAVVGPAVVLAVVEDHLAVVEACIDIQGRHHIGAGVARLSGNNLDSLHIVEGGAGAGVGGLFGGVGGVVALVVAEGDAIGRALTRGDGHLAVARVDADHGVGQRQREGLLGHRRTVLVADGDGLHCRGARRQVEGAAVGRAAAGRRVAVGGVVDGGTGAGGGQGDGVACARDGGSHHGAVSRNSGRGRLVAGACGRGGHRQCGCEVGGGLGRVRHRGAAARGRRARQLAGSVAAEGPGEGHVGVRLHSGAEASGAAVQRAVIVVVGVAASRQGGVGRDGGGGLGGRGR